MNQWDFLPLFWALLMAAFFFTAKKRKNFSFFKQVFWQLAFLFLVNLAISLLKTPFFRRILPFPKLPYFLWLFVLLVLLVFVIRVLGFFFFDFLFLKRQGIKYPKLFKDIVVFVLYIIGLILILHYYLNVKRVSIFLASSAVVTVIIGLAVQDILGNLFSGIVLNFDDSFKLGTWIRVGEFEGRIEQLGWRSIKVRTVDNHMVVIPNQAASKQDIVIFGESQQKPFALRMRIGVSYRSSPDLVMKTILLAVRSVDMILPDPSPSVLVVDFADSAITYEVRYWTRDLSARNAINSEIRRRVWYEFSRRSIQIPFPIRDVYLKKEPAAPIPREEVVAALRNNDMFRVIDEREFTNLLEGVDHHLYGKGETVIKEGEKSFFFFHILKGEVEVLKGMKSLTFLGPGEFFGEISLVTGEPPTATVVTRSESVLIRVSSNKFRETVNMNQELAQKLTDVITRRQTELRLFAEQVQEADVDKSIKKSSASLLRRIIDYFGSKKQIDSKKSL